MQSETITTLFWNLDQSLLVENIVRLVDVHGVDILLLAESPYASREIDLLSKLNQVPHLPGKERFVSMRVQGKQPVQVLTRLSRAIWQAKAIHSRYTIWEIVVAGRLRFIIATAHFPSIQDDQGDQQRECALALRMDLERIEGDWDDPLSVVIGDLNANPFDAGIAGIYGLNATQSRRIAQTRSRELNGVSYKFLYNPMWRFLGTELPGTYYRRLSAPLCYDWFLLDQVLVRPGMIRLFEENATSNLSILTHDGIVALAATGTLIPRWSDHLPLLFRFLLPEE